MMIFNFRNNPRRDQIHMTRDARGQSVSLLDPVVVHMLRQHEVIEADELEAIVDELEPGSARRLRHVKLMVVLTLVVIIVGISSMFLFGSPGARADLIDTLLNPAIMLPVFSGVLVTWMAGRQKRFPRVRSVMLRHERCPHCGYNLRGIPVQETDSATVCPECGCAWRLEVIADEGHGDLEAAVRTRGPFRLAMIAALLGLVALFGVALLVYFN